MMGMSSDAMQIIRRYGNDRNRRAHDYGRLTGVIGSSVVVKAGSVGVSAAGDFAYRPSPPIDFCD
jgi:hypothetical protein